MLRTSIVVIFDLLDMSVPKPDLVVFKHVTTSDGSKFHFGMVDNEYTIAVHNRIFEHHQSLAQGSHAIPYKVVSATGTVILHIHNCDSDYNVFKRNKLTFLLPDGYIPHDMFPKVAQNSITFLAMADVETSDGAKLKAQVGLSLEKGGDAALVVTVDGWHPAESKITLVACERQLMQD